MTENQESFKHLPEEQQKKIQASIDASSLKYEQIKVVNKTEADKRKAFRAKYHEGNEFLKKTYKKDDMIFDTLLVRKDFHVSCILVPLKDKVGCDKDFTHCILGYCIKAPLDKYIKHVATGLCGYRIKHNGEYTIELRIPNIIFEDISYLYELIRCVLMTKILLFAPKIPQRMINYISKEIKQVS